MITNRTYYKNNLYIPHAKPSATADVTTVSAELDSFIEKYERECLIKCLGFQLATALLGELDSTKANGLKDSADAKWDELLNGKSYTDGNGDAVVWRGIRFKEFDTDSNPSRSFLANYVFCNYEQNHDVFRVAVGSVKPKAANAFTVSNAPRVTQAWREMVEMIHGKEWKGQVIVKNIGWGVDYYYDNSEVSLHKFIRDMNDATTDYYPDFKPGYFNPMKNQFGI
jgi:hypothetical protein